jgi:hypothetical protein
VREWKWVLVQEQALAHVSRHFVIETKMWVIYYKNIFTIVHATYKLTIYDVVNYYSGLLATLLFLL